MGSCPIAGWQGGGQHYAHGRLNEGSSHTCYSREGPMRIHTFRTHRGVRRAVCFAVPAVAAVLVAFQVSTSAQQAGAAGALKPGMLKGSTTESMFDAKLKFHGANDC